MNRVRRPLRLLAFGIMLLALSVRIYRGVIPRGAALLPFVLFCAKGPTLSSPDGTRSVQVYFKDAGGAQVGPPEAWFIESNWLFGRRVIDEGKVHPRIANDGDPIPASWTPDNGLVIDFDAALGEKE